MDHRPFVSHGRALSMACTLAWGLVSAGAAWSGEGMWTPDRLPREVIKARYGVEPTAAWVEKIASAAVRVGGCTGTLVSDQGLVLTNHHCVSTCLSQLSSRERNLSEQGYLARTREEELRCPQLEVGQRLSDVDITPQVVARTQGLTGAAYQRAVDAVRAEVVGQCQREDATVRCDWVSHYRGGEYRLQRYRRWNDVRLVWAPEEAIGAFGGDVDNFQFPRWNLDAALLRVWVQGQAAPTPEHLRVRPLGPARGELLWIPGYPGSTQRLLTVAQLEVVRERLALRDVPRQSELRGLLLRLSSQPGETGRLALAALSGVENGLRVQQGQLGALLESDLLAVKQQQEAQERRWLADQSAASRVQWGDPWADLAAAAQARRRWGQLHEFAAEGRALPGPFFQQVLQLVRGVLERAKAPAERGRDFQESALPAVERMLSAAVPVHPEFEEARLAWSLNRMRSVLGADHPWVLALLGRSSPQSVAREWLTQTRLREPQERLRWWRSTPDELKAAPDPMLRALVAFAAITEPTRQVWEADVTAREAEAGARLARLQWARLGANLYPDATRSLRFSYGERRGWQEGKDGETIPDVTTWGGLLARATQEAPYALPLRWRQAFPKLQQLGLMDSPFNFSTDHDIIGGNSGSSVVNARGEVVGLAFDGNRHSLGGSFRFDERVNRAVAVHAGAITAALEWVYDAPHLLRELGVDSRGDQR